MSLVPPSHNPEIAELVVLHGLGVLPAHELARVDAHVAACSECRDELQHVHEFARKFAAWPTDVLRPPCSLWDRVAQRVASKGVQRPAVASVRTEPAWEQPGPGIECQQLAIDEASGRVSMVVRLALGSHYPPHRHAGVEELFLLAGELWIDARKLVPGDYNRAEPGTVDQLVWSETGCTCVLVTSTKDMLT